MRHSESPMRRTARFCRWFSMSGAPNDQAFGFHSLYLRGQISPWLQTLAIFLAYPIQDCGSTHP